MNIFYPCDFFDSSATEVFQQPANALWWLELVDSEMDNFTGSVFQKYNHDTATVYPIPF